MPEGYPAHWRPSGSIQTLRLRAALQAKIRRYFADRSVIEVTTPMLTPSGVTEPAIESLALKDSPLFLRTSPEYYHKRLLAAGFGDLYEMGPVMRAGEQGHLHQPEFTLLEWYRVGLTWDQLGAEALDLIQHCGTLVERQWQTRTVSWQALFVETLGFDPLSIEDAMLWQRTDTLPADCDRPMRLDYLFATRLQPALPEDQLTLVHHYPVSQAALAEADTTDPRFARRFEVFAGPVELANGYQELRDEAEQARRFASDNRRRRALNLPEMPIDPLLLAALAEGLPMCSGIAMGVDRLLMAMTGAETISDVVAFS